MKVKLNALLIALTGLMVVGAIQSSAAMGCAVGDRPPHSQPTPDSQGFNF